MNRYASKTVVGEDRSRAEIEKLLMRFGADQFAYATDEGRRAAAIQFRYKGLMVRMTLALPSPDDPRIIETPRGRRRSPGTRRVEYERERRRRWRALALAIKAKLVAVEEGITTFEIEWLPYVLWGDGRTTAEHLLPALAAGAALPLTPRTLLPGERGSADTGTYGMPGGDAHRQHRADAWAGGSLRPWILAPEWVPHHGHRRILSRFCG